MNKLKQLFRQSGFQLLLSCLLFVLMNWPFLAISVQRGLMAVFGYLFLLWGGIIFLAFLIGRSFRGNSSSENGDEEGGG